MKPRRKLARAPHRRLLARAWAAGQVFATLPLVGCSDDPAQQEPKGTPEPERTFGATMPERAVTADVPGGTAGTGERARYYGLTGTRGPGPTCVGCPERFPH
jgi:hypothetical protein